MADGSTHADRPERLVFLHGFTQTHHHWRRCAHEIAARLDPPPTLAFVDLPGHGLADGDRTDTIDTGARRLADVAGRGTYVGYSMGGRIALAAAAASAERAGPIERLVLVGATAGIDDAAERAARRASDAALAERIVEAGVAAFLDEWLALPLFAGLSPDPDGRARRAANSADGLAHSLTAYGTGSMTPLWDRLPSITVPVLIVVGELDTKFTALGRRLADGLPDATLAIVPSAGHAVHIEATDAVADVVAGWLAA